MTQSYFQELKEWSERKHELLTKYLDGFVRILGGSTGLVYYVDGFAGQGIYDDGAKGSPVLAAEYAAGLEGKHYRLHCLNVEVDDQHFENLSANTEAFSGVATNYHGEFGQHVDSIVSQIGLQPAIFFLDPFGLKGIEWEHIHKALTEPNVSELLIRIKPSDLARHAGFLDSDVEEAAAKRQNLTDLLGFANEKDWAIVWQAERVDGLVRLYIDHLRETVNDVRGDAYVYYYPIRTLEGEFKYFLIFATGHPKGAVLMSDIVYGVEAQYRHDVEEFKIRKTGQLRLFDGEPPEEEVINAVVEDLKVDIMSQFRGEKANRLSIHAAMLNKWFGRSKKMHFTRAFRQLEDAGQIIDRTGRRSHDYTVFTLAD